MKLTSKGLGSLVATLAVVATGGTLIASTGDTGAAVRTGAAGKVSDGCVPVPGAVCGTIRVPLVRAQPGAGSTTVAYALIGHRDTSRPAKGTVTIDPGGPGDSAIASASRYAQMYGGLLNDHDLLLVDPRGLTAPLPEGRGFFESLPP